MAERIIHGCRNEVTRDQVHYKGPPGESSEYAPGMRPASYRDVEDEDAGAVLRHMKERKEL